MKEILSILTQGLAVCSQKHTAATLGDRSRYVGMSDIGKAADCLRAAVASKVYPAEDPGIRQPGCSRCAPAHAAWTLV